MRKFVLVLAAMALVLPASVSAQDKPVEINLGGGVSFPTGDLADSFDTGWNGAVGVTFNFTPNVGFQAEYMYQRFGGPDRQISLLPTPVDDDSDTLGTIESNHQMHAGTFNLVVRSNTGGAANGYFLVGPGVYNRKVQLTSPSVGYTTICDPYWLVCYPGLVPVDTIIGDRSSTDFGFNVGGGVTFGQAAKFYVEARYHYVWGPKITAPGGGTEYSTNASYFPTTFGFRF
jgi:opacity protein-like surface antigen